MRAPARLRPRACRRRRSTRAVRRPSRGRGLETWTRVLELGDSSGAWDESGLTLPPAPEPPEVPELVDGRFEVAEVLAHGAMGQVLRAWDRRRGRWVALKRPLSGSGGVDAVRGVLREAEITRNLEHPGAPTVYDLGIDADGVPYFTMALIPGQTLGALIADLRAGRVERSIAWRVEVVAQVADVLACAHAHGIVHRDVKPDNVIVTPAGRAVLIDWGLATGTWRADGGVPLRERRGRWCDSDDSTVAGTPIYMAPEAMRGASGPRTDVYSLSALLYELLTLQHYLPETPEAEFVRLAEQVRCLEPSPADERVLDGHPAVPLELSEVCTRGLEKDPLLRTADVASVRDALRRWRRLRPWWWVRDSGALWVAAGLSVAAALGLLTTV